MPDSSSALNIRFLRVSDSTIRISQRHEWFRGCISTMYVSYLCQRFYEVCTNEVERKGCGCPINRTDIQMILHLVWRSVAMCYVHSSLGSLWKRSYSAQHWHHSWRFGQCWPCSVSGQEDLRWNGWQNSSWSHVPEKNQVVTWDTRSSVKTGKETVLIDPQLLFQRLSTAGSRCDDLTDVFKYELCSYPPALFQTIDILLEADKPALAEAIWKQLPLSFATQCCHRMCNMFWMVGHCYIEFLGILARPMKESPVTTCDMLETGMVTLSLCSMDMWGHPPPKM